MSERIVNIKSGDVMLEGQLSCPEDGGLHAAVVICHPHPMHGGDMYNNVVEAVYWELTKRSIVALRFNFRGVGNSGGTADDSIGHGKDVGAAIDFLLTIGGVDGARIGVVGYSYGAATALRYVPGDERVKAIAMVSPAIAVLINDPIMQYDKPKFFISGDRDGVVPAHKFQYLIDNIAESKSHRLVAGVDHFWSHHEDVMAEAVLSFLNDVLV
jgi:uncharacterized protein